MSVDFLHDGHPIGSRGSSHSRPLVDMPEQVSGAGFLALFQTPPFSAPGPAMRLGPVLADDQATPGESLGNFTGDPGRDEDASEGSSMAGAAGETPPQASRFETGALSVGLTASTGSTVESVAKATDGDAPVVRESTQSGAGFQDSTAASRAGDRVAYGVGPEAKPGPADAVSARSVLLQSEAAAEVSELAAAPKPQDSALRSISGGPGEITEVALKASVPMELRTIPHGASPDGAPVPVGFIPASGMQLSASAIQMREDDRHVAKAAANDDRLKVLAPIAANVTQPSQFITNGMPYRLFELHSEAMASAVADGGTEEWELDVVPFGHGSSEGRMTSMTAGATVGLSHSPTPSPASQLAHAAAANPSGTTVLMLVPEELGKVTFSMSSDNQSVIMHVLADRPETLDLLRRNIESLAQELRDLGFRNVSFQFAGGDSSQPRDGRSTSAHGLEDSGEMQEAELPKGHATTLGHLDIRL